jgi:hypothetical protein
MSVGDAMGWLAAALTLLAFLMRSMTALRVVAIAANLCFILYGAMNWAYPVLVLHIALLPCNLLRLCELRRAGGGRAVPRRL